MGNFMKAYTIAFEASNGDQVASRAIVPFLKKIEEVLENTPITICFGLRHGSQPCLFPYRCLSYNKGSNWLTIHSLGLDVRF